MDFTKSIKKYFDLYEKWKHKASKFVICYFRTTSREIYSIKCLFRKKGNDMQDLSFYPKKQKNKQTKSAN